MGGEVTLFVSPVSAVYTELLFLMKRTIKRVPKFSTVPAPGLPSNSKNNVKFCGSGSSIFPYQAATLWTCGLRSTLIPGQP